MGIIVFLGDSITDAGRMTSDNPLGDGYVSEFAAYITGTNPNWRVLNRRSPAEGLYFLSSGLREYSGGHQRCGAYCTG